MIPDPETLVGGAGKGTQQYTTCFELVEEDLYPADSSTARKHDLALQLSPMGELTNRPSQHHEA